MKILDRYILISYTKKLVWAMVAAIVIFLVVDVVENNDKFIDHNASIVHIARYYYLYLPYVFYLILPAATLLATLFIIGGMTMNNELIAIKVSGVPFLRALIILMIGTAPWAYGAYVLGESIIPQYNKERLDVFRYDIKKMPRENKARLGRLYVQLEPGKQLFIDNYKALTYEAYGIKIFDVNDGRISRRVDADKMVWRDNNWIVQGAVEREFNADGTVKWKRNMDLNVSGDGLRPDEFERIRTKPEELNGQELREFIVRQKVAGNSTLKWEVELLSKASLPTAALIIVLFGAPIAAVKRRSGGTLSFGIALFICFIYFGFIHIGKILGINGTLQPWLGAWIGNIFFGLFGMFLLMRNKS